MKMRTLLLAAFLLFPSPGASRAAGEVGDEAVVAFFQGLGISSTVRHSGIVGGFSGPAINVDSLELYEIKLGTPAAAGLGLPPDTQPEPRPTPVEYKVSPLGRDLYGMLIRLTPDQLKGLRESLTGRNPSPRRIEEAVRILKSYLQPMGLATDPQGSTHAQLFPEDVEAFRAHALKALSGELEIGAPAFPGPAAPAAAPARATEEVLRVARSRAQFQKGLMGAREFLGRALDATQVSLSSTLDLRAAAGANRQEIDQLKAGVQFMGWLNGPKTKAALKADPARREELQRIVSAVNDLVKPGGGGRSQRQEALYPLVKFVHESQLTQQQWTELIDRFPMGDSINRMGWAKLWRMGITGRMADGTPLDVGVIGGGVDTKHPLLAGRVTQVEDLTFERSLPAGASAPRPKHESIHETRTGSVIAAALPDAGIRSYKNLEDQGAAVPPWRRKSNDIMYGDGLVRSIDAARRDRVAAVNISQGTRIGMGVLPGNSIDAAVARAHADGVAVVSAAGNDGLGVRSLPSSVSLSVGSLDPKGQASQFSSEGDVVLLSPDGKARLETKPDIMAPGELRMARYDPTGRYADPEALYAEAQGTSYASPWVTAAMAALTQVARESGAEVTVEEKMDILRRTGTRVDVPLHPLGIPSLNPAAAVAELQRRLAARNPQVAKGTGPASLIDELDPAKLTVKLMRLLAPRPGPSS